jgi:hypothetical protein
MSFIYLFAIIINLIYLQVIKTFLRNLSLLLLNRIKIFYILLIIIIYVKANLIKL